MQCHKLMRHGLLVTHTASRGDSPISGPHQRGVRTPRPVTASDELQQKHPPRPPALAEPGGDHFHTLSHFFLHSQHLKAMAIQLSGDTTAKVATDCSITKSLKKNKPTTHPGMTFSCHLFDGGRLTLLSMSPSAWYHLLLRWKGLILHTIKKSLVVVLQFPAR